MIVLTHNGFDNLNKPVSKIYLGDLERRTALGGGVVVGQNGQDCYINPFQSISISDTSKFKLSFANGLIKSYVNRSVFSIQQFDSLLNKLDFDTHVSFVNYYETLNLSSGLSPINLFNSLLIKLDNDIGLSDSDYTNLSIDIPTKIFSTQFNLLLQKLDSDPGATDVDYFNTLKG